YSNRDTARVNSGCVLGRNGTGPASAWDYGWSDTTRPFTGRRIQSIYQKDRHMFSTTFGNYPPEGLVSNVYIRICCSSVEPDSETVYYDFKIRMGYTNRNGFTGNRLPFIDTFVTGLQTVYAANVLSGYFGRQPGKWLKFPASNFYYRQTQNLAVEISAGSKKAKFPIIFEQSSWQNNGGSGVIQGWNDTLYGSSSIGFNCLSFGLDLQTTGVEAEGNMKSIGVFPNPSSDHKVMVSIDGQESLKELQVRVSNSLGQEVYSNVYRQVGTSFLQQLNLTTQPPGMYSIELSSGGQRITRRVSLE
ncbi:MAG: T9SS type A sorting domain-containing protein, partial [Chitinophagaceae bacterium]